MQKGAVNVSNTFTVYNTFNTINRFMLKRSKTVVSFKNSPVSLLN